MVPAAPLTPSRERLRVLVVDDNADAARALALLLDHYGFEVSVAFDGESAVARADETQPQIAILDIGLPGMDGCDVARWIRRQPWGAGVSLIALSGWGQEADRARSREAGIDVHLVKPADAAELVRVLDGVRAKASRS
jgi:DNA-binding response OmpR family regulator